MSWPVRGSQNFLCKYYRGILWDAQNATKTPYVHSCAAAGSLRLSIGVIPEPPRSHEPGTSQALLSIGDLPPERGSVVTSAIYMTGVSMMLTPVIFSVLSTIMGPSVQALLLLVVVFWYVL